MGKLKEAKGLHSVCSTAVRFTSKWLHE